MQMFDKAEAEYAELSSKKRIVETDRAKIEKVGPACVAVQVTSLCSSASAAVRPAATQTSLPEFHHQMQTTQPACMYGHGQARLYPGLPSRTKTGQQS